MLRSLEQLDLSKNEICDLEDIFALLSSLSGLTELDLRMNPVTNTPKYREKVVTFSSSRLGASLSCLTIWISCLVVVVVCVDTDLPCWTLHRLTQSYWTRRTSTRTSGA